MTFTFNPNGDSPCLHRSLALIKGMWSSPSAPTSCRPKDTADCQDERGYDLVVASAITRARRARTTI